MTTCSHRTSHLTLASHDVAELYSAVASSRVGCRALQPLQRVTALQLYSSTASTFYSTLHRPSAGKPTPARRRRGVASAMSDGEADAWAGDEVDAVPDEAVAAARAALGGRHRDARAAPAPRARSEGSGDDRARGAARTERTCTMTKHYSRRGFLSSTLRAASSRHEIVDLFHNLETRSSKLAPRAHLPPLLVPSSPANASSGTSTFPTRRMRFLPSFCRESSFFFRETSPP